MLHLWCMAACTVLRHTSDLLMADSHMTPSLLQVGSAHPSGRALQTPHSPASPFASAAPPRLPEATDFSLGGVADTLAAAHGVSITSPTVHTRTHLCRNTLPLDVLLTASLCPCRPHMC